MKKLLLALVLGIGLFGIAASQYQSPLVAQGNPQCPTRPPTDNSNACASTAFVQTAVGGVINTLCTLLPNTCVSIFGYANIIWFGATANSGVTDNGPFLRLTKTAALAASAPIYIGPSSGYYGVSTCVNNAVFDMSGADGNKSLSIFGGGWNEKPFASPTGSWLLPNSSFPATCSWVRYSGTDKVTGVTFKNFGIGEFGGSLGTPKGLHGIFIDASNPAFYLQDMIIDHIYIANMSVGKSIQVSAVDSAPFAGGLANSTVYDSRFMNFEATALGDRVSFAGNTTGQNATNDSRNVGFIYWNCSGCTTTEISRNNIDNISGAVIADGGVGSIIERNEVEQTAFANLLGKSIWLRGTQSIVINAKVQRNNISVFNAVGTVSPITVDNAQDASVANNWIITPTNVAYPHITTTSGASDTSIRDNSCYNPTLTLSCSITNTGLFTGYLDTRSIGLSGTTDGKMGSLSAPANANGLTWLLPNVSGTIADGASSPLVLNSTTGNLTCPTCVTSSGGGTITGTSPIVVSAAGVVSFAPAGTSFGVLYNNASALGNTAAGTNGQVFLGVTGSAPNWGTMSGDATITNIGVVTLASTISAAGPIGSATVAPIITFDAKGRLTTVTSATITPAASSITGGAALTKVDDTNVTLTLGGSPTTALLAATSITAGWTGTLANSRLATMVTNTVKGNATSGTASPTDLAVATCSTAASALIWTTNTGFGCNTSITANSATSATNATNGATVATTTNASFFPLFAASSTNSNQPFNLDTTLTYNPSTDTLTATNFAGNATTATTATTGTNATNTAITDDNSTNATMYPTWVTAATGNLPQKVSSTKVTFNPSTGSFSVPVLLMAAGSGAFGAGTSATSGQLTTMLLNGGSTAGSYMAWQAGNVTYAFLGDDRAILGAANDNFLIQTQSGDGFHIQTNGANTDRFAISSAGVVSMPTLGSDTATVDNTVCVSSTGVILKGSGALGVCLGTSSARYKHDIVSMGVGLAEIIKLTPKNFFYNKGFGDDGYRLQYGFIAEDVIKVLPELVGLDNNQKPNSVDMLAMVPIMVSAIKQLKSANDNLEARIVKLETRK